MRIMLSIIFISSIYITSSPAYEEPISIKNLPPPALESGKTNSGQIEKAVELITSSKPEESLCILSKYKPSSDEFSRYHDAYGQALELAGSRHDSIEHYRLAYLYAGSEEEKERLLLKRAGKPFLNVCKWILKYGKEDERSLIGLLLADFYAGIGDGAAALKHLNKARGKALTDDYFRTAAKVFSANGECRKAADALMSIREVREDDILMLLDAANATKNIKPALAFTERSLNKIPGTIRTYIRFADLLFEAGKKSEAQRYYEAVISAKSDTKTGAGDAEKAKDVEWARYRLAAMSAGRDGRKSAEPSSGVNVSSAGGKSSADRLREADLKGAEIFKKVKYPAPRGGASFSAA